jgi:enoyl-CoA hydratase/carnithine racemase
MGQIIFKRESGIGLIEISDPERHNAMSLGMWTALADAVTEIDADPSVRVCVVRGAGDRAFVSGANISEFETERNSPDAVARYNAQVERAQTGLARCRVPVIAAISGYCFGGGLGLALSCDLRYASTTARFRMPAARLGLGYGYESMRSFVAQLGPQAAAEAFFTARIYDAQAALGLGIVRAVVDDVFGHVQSLAVEIAGNAPLTVQAGKQAMRAALEGQTDLAAVRAAIDQCFTSQDYAEGRLAFAEKRPPRFVGR